MAALVEGQQYGLSAQDKINCTKSLVFVKLTDSAIRSIEEYVKNKADNISRPTIQFSNSNGVISLPHHGSSQNFGFTLSNVEADGPHGSFECLRQTGYRSLESLGCLQLKMHIHATEDSYENTRVKMAAVEKEQKKSCTKVIKPAGAHLGRKVKVKRPGLVVSPIKSSPPTASMINKNPLKPLHATPVAPSSVPAKKPELPPRPKVTPKNPELIRQPIRDRIIHILAVRPYKRPELLVRLNSDGLREKDRNKLSSILPQLSVLKGNIYYLAKGCWKEVQENWKFCTQDELEIIRKRKQQNESTPDTVEHNSPSTIPQTNSSPLQKRILNEVETNGHPRNKKQRISHYKGDQQRNGYSYSPSDVITTTLSKKTSYSPGPTPTNGNEDNSSQRSSPSSESYTPRSDALSSPSLSQRTREDGERAVRSHTAGLSHAAYQAPADKPPPKPRPPVRGVRTEPEEPPRTYPKSSVNSDMGKSQTLSHLRSVESPQSQVSPDSNTQFQAKEDPCSKTETNGYVNSKSIKSGFSSSQSSYVNRSKVTSTTNGSCSNSPHSSSDSTDSMDYNDTNLQVLPLSESPSQCDSPNYEKEYCRIESSEQRARYKANFNAEYQEYLRLYQKIMNISRKFASMELHLKTCQPGSEEFMKIKGKIIKDYRTYQRDENYLDSLKKFNYLHTKLAYIKRLVTEYDTAQCAKS